MRRAIRRIRQIDDEDRHGLSEHVTGALPRQHIDKEDISANLRSKRSYGFLLEGAIPKTLDDPTCKVITIAVAASQVEIRRISYAFIIGFGILGPNMVKHLQRPICSTSISPASYA
jgi:hypothetical protein